MTFSIHKLFAESAELDRVLRSNPESLEWLTDVNVPEQEQIAIKDESEEVQEELEELIDVEIPNLETEAIEDLHDNDEVEEEPLVLPESEDAPLPDLDYEDPDHGQVGDTENEEGEIDSIPVNVQTDEITEIDVTSEGLSDPEQFEDNGDVVDEMEELPEVDVLESNETYATDFNDPETSGLPSLDASVDETITDSSETIEPNDETEDTEYESLPEVPEYSQEPLDSISEPSVTTDEVSDTPDGDVPSANEFEALPDVSFDLPQLNTMEEPQLEPVGFMGFNDLPDVTERQLDLQNLEDPSLSHNERVEQQIEFQMRSNEDLASQLGLELGPQFDSMREENAQVVHDYVESQALLTALLRPKDYM